MAWLDYTFHSHPKIAAIPNSAAGVFAKCISYCSANLTDGFVPAKVAAGWQPKGRQTAALCRVGLITEVPGGFQVRDYLSYNPSKADVEEKRRKAREKKRQQREASQGDKTGSAESVAEGHDIHVP